ncbi:MAG TPA: carbamoyltransferase HypF, partial [Acidimicrobiales bacterium]
AEGTSALTAAVAALRAGRIVAVKGIGGYHLAVDATNPEAVAELRRRKERDDKPFAVMVAGLDEATALCVLDPDARKALASPRRPIVLAPRRPDAAVADAVAPALAELGLLLPYSPFHHLLMRGVARPLVMTSGNLSDEPIAHDDDDAVARLGPLVDGLLTHDRPIHIRCDDSVVRAGGGRLQLLRRSRGYAPEPLALPFAAHRAVLAVGAELKSTVSVAKGRIVVPSHHVGDLEHLATHRSFVQALDHLCRLYGVTPEVVAHDLHPEYLSTKLARGLELPTLGVQHHHAHVAACMVEHGRTEPVLGLAFDGLGYGPDGTLWGGEVLVADLTAYERVGHLVSMPMPGGVAAIREPWRMAAVWAAASGGRGAVARALPGLDASTTEAVLDLAERGLTPCTTSMGRLFDAVAALLGGRRTVSYEAQAAVELEALARTVSRADAPTYDSTVIVADADGVAVLDPTALVARLIQERDRGGPPATIAAGFHEAIGRASAALAADLARRRGLDTVALTGGVFQNARLTDVVEAALVEDGFTVLVHRTIPPNDGGISVGQAAIAAFAP